METLMRCFESPGIGDLLRWTQFAGVHGCRGRRVSLTCSLCNGSMRGVMSYSGRRSWSWYGLRGSLTAGGTLGVVGLVWLAGRLRNLRTVDHRERGKSLERVLCQSHRGSQGFKSEDYGPQGTQSERSQALRRGSFMNWTLGS